MNGKPWTGEDRALLLRLQDQGVKRAAVYAYFPHRTRCAVSLYMTKHGLFPVHAWTMRERDKLRELWAGGHSRAAIARALGRTRGAVAFQVREMKLEPRKPWRRWTDGQRMVVAREVDSLIRRLSDRFGLAPEFITGPVYREIRRHHKRRRALDRAERLEEIA